MKVHGHEIPEEFVREVEALILLILGSGCPFSARRMASSLWFHGNIESEIRRVKPKDDSLDSMVFLGALVKRILRRLRAAGKIEYLGRSQGWRVKG